MNVRLHFKRREPNERNRWKKENTNFSSLIATYFHIGQTYITQQTPPPYFLFFLLPSPNYTQLTSIMVLPTVGKKNWGTNYPHFHKPLSLWVDLLKKYSPSEFFRNKNRDIAHISPNILCFVLFSALPQVIEVLGNSITKEQVYRFTDTFFTSLPNCWKKSIFSAKEGKIGKKV